MADGAPMQVERKGRDPYTAYITPKQGIATNFAPIFRDITRAMARRLRVLTFNHSIPDAEQDIHLAKTILESPLERGALLDWALHGLCDLLDSGMYVKPSTSVAAVKAWLGDSDVVGTFIAERCKVGKDLRAKRTGLYQAFHTWCVDNGHKPPSSKSFRQSLLERDDGITEDPSRTYGRCYLGIALCDEDEGEPLPNPREQEFVDRVSRSTAGAFGQVDDFLYGRLE